MLKISPLFHALLKKLLDAWKVEIIKIKSRRQASISNRTNFFSTILLRLLERCQNLPIIRFFIR